MIAAALVAQYLMYTSRSANTTIYCTVWSSSAPLATTAAIVELFQCNSSRRRDAVAPFPPKQAFLLEKPPRHGVSLS